MNACGPTPSGRRLGERWRPRRRARVGLVEDDDDYRGIVHGWLLERYDASSFSSAEELLERLEQLPFDLLLVDIGLPGLDGVALAEAVARGPRAIPVIMLTASRRNRDYLRCLEAGRTAYLTKPISRMDLLWRIDAALAGPD